MIVLSQDIGPVQKQSDQTRGTREFRDDLGAMTETGQGPSEPMATAITARAQTLAEETKDTEGKFADDVKSYTESIVDSIDHLAEVDKTNHGDFNALWKVLEVDYGAFLERWRARRGAHREEILKSFDERLDRPVDPIQLVAIGRENFKTLYYAKEVSVLSRTLLTVSLPAILAYAMAISISTADHFSDFWLAWKLSVNPALQIFLAAAFIIALLPYVVLTSYMLRPSTVGI